MRATPAATGAFVIFLLKQGYSVRDIEKKTDVRRSSMRRIKEVMNTYQENNFGGCSSKLSTHDTTSISH